MPESVEWWTGIGLTLAACVAAGVFAGYLSRAGHCDKHRTGDRPWWPH